MNFFFHLSAMFICKFLKIHYILTPPPLFFFSLFLFSSADELTVHGFKFKLDKIAKQFSEELESLKPKLDELKLSVLAGESQKQEHSQEDGKTISSSNTEIYHKVDSNMSHNMCSTKLMQQEQPEAGQQYAKAKETKLEQAITKVDSNMSHNMCSTRRKRN